MKAVGVMPVSTESVRDKYPTIKLKYAATEIREYVRHATYRDIPYYGLEHIRSYTGEFVENSDEMPIGLVARFRPGQVLFGKLRPYLAKIGLPTFDGTTSTEVIVLEAKANCDPRFLRYVLLSKPFLDAVSVSTYGTRMPRTSWDIIGNMRVPNPRLDSQRRIADFLDRETARIDELIAGKERLIGLVRPKWEAIIHDVRRHSNWVRFGYVSKRQIRPVAREDSRTYTALGLFNRGRGLFHKDPLLGNELGESDFNWVHSGDLILSGQFAWEGAVATAGPDEMKTIVSHRYPLYRGSAGVETAYLFAYLRTEPGDFILNECSRGAAGRNRPLNTRLLEKEKIPVPPVDVQKKVAQLVAVERTLRSTIEKTIARLGELRGALITAAVTGQIDVDTWRQKAETERRIDEIEAEAAGA